MHAEDLKKLNEHFYDEVFGRRHIEAIDELLTDDFIEHTPAPGQATDRQGTKDFIGKLLQALPDLRLRIENQTAEGDMIATVVRMSGIHTSEFMGVPATGRRFSVIVMDTGRVRDGRFSEHWGLVDTSALMTQLGMNPSR